MKATVKDGGGQPFSPSGGSRREVGRRFTRRHPGRALVPLTGQFWWALFCATLLLGQESLAIVPACQEYVRRFIAWRRGTTGG
ncbi:hypothetical protein [Nonomuraea basaltis]|uniref:hypothetical protein n=1 Tax=Nonomuraea basaltis TaxID=2495887 RepID=UPI00110C58FC|nr:hypothetical protein [Nonomuraea basaltis]TMR93807.1 hypothetical protein EJK15_37105 [Nonomuraea basaltis]